LGFFDDFDFAFICHVFLHVLNVSFRFISSSSFFDKMKIKFWRQKSRDLSRLFCCGLGGRSKNRGHGVAAQGEDEFSIRIMMNFALFDFPKN
jgi:hypothetical protein